VYRRSKANLLRRNLENSRYFGLVDVQAVPGPDQLVAVQVNLTDASRHDVGLGIGFDTDSGLRARLRWDLPRLNRYGHTLHNEATLSSPIQEVASTYRIPLSDPLVKSLNFTAAWDKREVEETHTTVTRFDSWVLDQWWADWIVSWGAGLYQETSREGSEPSVSTSYVLPRLTFNHALRLFVPDPVVGHSTWFSVAGSAQALGADTEFVRVQAGYKRLVDLGGPHLLIGRVELGAIITDDIFGVPLSQRFFTGGDQTVRGYELNSLSPRNDEGDLTGGQYLNVASLEYSVRVLPSWRVGFFTDAGRAYNAAGAPWHFGAGIGARWLSPIGQVRVDVAFPIDDEFESGPRLHIFMGPLL
jgi:translocation and assembly module TamA